MITYYDEWRDTSITIKRTYIPYVQLLNLRIKNQLRLATTRPSKQSRKEAQSRAAYYTKQRDSILNLYPEYFL